MNPRTKGKLLVAGLIILGIAAATGPVISRLRDLQDVKLPTTIPSGNVLTWNGTQWTNSTGSTNISNVAISNAYITNLTAEIVNFFNAYVSNLFTINGSHNTLVVTQYVRMPWLTLTNSGTNVQMVDLALASMFRLYLTNHAFFGAVTNHPGTNIAQTVQIAIIEPPSGGPFTLTMTNSTWDLNGLGSTTNAMPTLNTNANGLTLLTFVTSPTNAAQLMGVTTTISP